jgi:hypothetical protein
MTHPESYPPHSPLIASGTPSHRVNARRNGVEVHKIAKQFGCIVSAVYARTNHLKRKLK